MLHVNRDTDGDPSLHAVSKYALVRPVKGEQPIHEQLHLIPAR